MKGDFVCIKLENFHTYIKTLRHYDKINLLKPKKIDNFTRYRYYDNTQIELLQKIKLQQTAGFSLKEIKNIISDNNNESKRIKFKAI